MTRMEFFRPGTAFLLALIGAIGLCATGSAQPPKRITIKAPPQVEKVDELPPEEAAMVDQISNLLGQKAMKIDLASALSLAGVRNPDILIARQRVLEEVARRQFAAAQILPSLNYGGDMDKHNGKLQQSSGNVITVDRDSLYLGAGAASFAAGTVNVPGLMYNLNLSQTIFNFLIAQQAVIQKQFASRAKQNEVLREVALAYNELLAAEARRALTRRVLQEAKEIREATNAFAKAGVGRQADADRASSEYLQRFADYLEANAQVLIASAHLAQILNLPPDVKLYALETKLVPMSLVPDPVPMKQLLAIALLNRPEMQEKQVLVRRTLMQLRSARLLPFSPNIFLGFSYGMFGGGSNLANEPVGTTPFARGQSRYGRFANRVDFDAMAYWALQNLAVGNIAMIRGARAEWNGANFESLITMNRIRNEVANAYTQARARFARIEMAEKAVRSIKQTFTADFRLVYGGLGHPVELLDALNLLARSRQEYLNSIVEYNRAEIDLFVALGNPPADALVRRVPRTFTSPETTIPQGKKR